MQDAVKYIVLPFARVSSLLTSSSSAVYLHETYKGSTQGRYSEGAVRDEVEDNEIHHSLAKEMQLTMIPFAEESTRYLLVFPVYKEAI